MSVCCVPYVFDASERWSVCVCVCSVHDTKMGTHIGWSNKIVKIRSALFSTANYLKNSNYSNQLNSCGFGNSVPCTVYTVQNVHDSY